MAEFEAEHLHPDDTQHPAQPADECPEVLRSTMDGEPGLMEIALDPPRQEVSFSYDPHQIPRQGIERIARDMQPALQERFDTCTMRLQPQGGRACEACAARLERRIHNLEGVHHATASYLGGALTVTYDRTLLSPGEIAEKARTFGATIPGEGLALQTARQQAAADRWPGIGLPTWPAERWEALLTLVTLLAMVAGLLAERTAAAPQVIQIWYGVAYLAGGAFGVKAGLESLRHLTVDVDLLMVLAALGAWIVGSPFEGAMLLFLFSLSNVLQAYALGRTRKAIRALMQLRPSQALTRRGGRNMMLPVEDLLVGDLVLVRPGERIPVDGQVVEGESTIDQAPITGESMPVSRRLGDPVLSGTINQSGGLEVRVTRRAQDSTIAKMIRLVEEAQSQKANTQRFIDRFEQVYAWAVILLTLGLILIPPYVLGAPFESSFYRAMTAMVAASPCALVISTPASILSAIGNGARRGVLFKGGMHLESAADIRVVAFDKTGTLTEGRPYVTAILPHPDWKGDEAELLALAAAVEARSEHPLGRAILQAAQKRQVAIPEASDFQADTSLGVRAMVQGQGVCLGSPRYMADFPGVDLGPLAVELERQEAAGITPILIGQGEPGGQVRLIGLIGVADRLRPNADRVVAELKTSGVRVVMLTGDNSRVARAIAEQAGVDEYHAELMPEEKVSRVREIEARYGPVAMVGDGVNDAPALASARLGIAMGAAGTDVALETADVVLMADELNNIPYVMDLSRRTRRTLTVNLGFSLLMIALMLVAIFFANFSLPLAVVGHEGGTVLVSLNGLRLLFYKPQ